MDILPAALGGSQSLTNAEKLNKAITMTALYGADGLGLSAQVDKWADQLGIEKDNPLYDLLRQGSMELGIQALFDSDADLGGSLGLKGLSLVLDANNITNFLDKGFLNGVPVGSVAGRYLQAYQDWKYIHARGSGTVEELGDTLQAIGSIVSGVSNPMKAIIFNELSNKTYTANGNQLSQGTTSDMVFKAIFGVGTNAESNYYMAMKEMNSNRSMEAKSSKDLTGYLKQDAEVIANAVKRDLVYYQNIDPSSMKGREAMFKTLKSVVNSLGQDHVYTQQLKSEVWKTISKSSTEDAFNTAYGKLMKQSGRVSAEEFKHKVESMRPYMTPKQQELMDEQIRLLDKANED
jgi:hypothetical protein